MAKFVLKLGDESWPFDDAGLSLKDAFAIKSATGLNVPPFLQGIQEYNPASLQGLVWLLRHKAGENVRVEDVDFLLKDLSLEFAEPVVSADAPDPT
jgi:hypothetical protein